MIAVRLLVCLGLIASAVVDAIAVDVDQTTYSLNVANNVKVRVDNFNQHTVFSVLRGNLFNINKFGFIFLICLEMQKPIREEGGTFFNGEP